MGYLLDRWETLTKFLRVPGAPLDNNPTERLLKAAILHRKNSLHDKTQRGADVGDTFMTVIETCRANGVNPFDSMLAVVKNAEAAGQDPGKWMPWNDPQPGRFSWEGSDGEADASASRGGSEARADARPVTSEGRGICRSRSSKHDRSN